MMVHISWGTSDFGIELDIAIDSQIETQLKILNNQIEDVSNCIDAWVEHRHGKNLLSASTTGVFQVEPEFVREIPQLITLLDSSCPMKFHFGVGVEVEESNTALKFAVKHGDQIALYDDAMLEDEDEEEDPLLKGELEHPDDEGQMAIDAKDPTDAIMDALSKIRDNADAIERLRQSNPEAYKAFRNITQAMVAMAKQISDVKTAAEGEAAGLEKTMETPTDASNKMGADQSYQAMGEQLKHMDHFKTEKVGGGLFHHAFKGGPSGELMSHTMSLHEDPRQPHVAQMHGMMADDYAGLPAFEVSTSSAHPQYKGSGFGKALYLSALKHHGTMLSDTHTSSRANNAWNWLGAQNGVAFQPGAPGIGRHVATMTKSEDIEELLKAIRLPKPKKTPKRITAKFPTPPAMIAAAPGSIKDGKIKATSIEPSTLATRKTGWNSVRAGMIVSPKGSPVSSREPDSE